MGAKSQVSGVGSVKSPRRATASGAEEESPEAGNLLWRSDHGWGGPAAAVQTLISPVNDCHVKCGQAFQIRHRECLVEDGSWNWHTRDYVFCKGNECWQIHAWSACANLGFFGTIEARVRHLHAVMAVVLHGCLRVALYATIAALPGRMSLDVCHCLALFLRRGPCRRVACQLRGGQDSAFSSDCPASMAVSRPCSGRRHCKGRRCAQNTPSEGAGRGIMRSTSAERPERKMQSNKPQCRAICMKHAEQPAAM